MSLRLMSRLVDVRAWVETEERSGGRVELCLPPFKLVVPAELAGKQFAGDRHLSAAGFVRHGSLLYVN